MSVSQPYVRIVRRVCCVSQQRARTSVFLLALKIVNLWQVLGSHQGALQTERATTSETLIVLSPSSKFDQWENQQDHGVSFSVCMVRFLLYLDNRTLNLLITTIGGGECCTCVSLRREHGITGHTGESVAIARGGRINRRTSKENTAKNFCCGALAAAAPHHHVLHLFQEKSAKDFADSLMEVQDLPELKEIKELYRALKKADEDWVASFRDNGGVAGIYKVMGGCMIP